MWKELEKSKKRIALYLLKNPDARQRDIKKDVRKENGEKYSKFAISNSLKKMNDMNLIMCRKEHAEGTGNWWKEYRLKKENIKVNKNSDKYVPEVGSMAVGFFLTGALSFFMGETNIFLGGGLAIIPLFFYETYKLLSLRDYTIAKYKENP